MQVEPRGPRELVEEARGDVGREPPTRMSEKSTFVTNARLVVDLERGGCERLVGRQSDHRAQPAPAAESGRERAAERRARPAGDRLVGAAGRDLERRA